MPTLREIYDPLFTNKCPNDELLELVGRVMEDVFPTRTPRLEMNVRVSGVSERDTWALRMPPRKRAERFFNLQRWTRMPRGGHFAAMEEPELLAQDLREFFRVYRG